MKDFKQFMDNIDLPKISKDHEQGLNKDITVTEIENELQQMKLGKSSGLDGLTLEFHRSFKIEPTPYLQELFTYWLAQWKIPSSWTEAELVLIPKRNRDIRYPEAYRPISILNTDNKILTPILANRLSIIIGSYIHQDQTGYIRGRYLKDNISCVINIINKAQVEDTSGVFIFLDAEKALDKIEWQYLHCVTSKLGLGEFFSADSRFCIKTNLLLYRNCRAAIGDV